MSTPDSTALTHAAFSEFCSRSARARPEISPVFVQIRRRGETFCDCLLEARHFHDRDWFAVQTLIDDRVWVESRNVRLCSGDGRCICEPAA